MLAGPCTGARRCKLPTGHPSRLRAGVQVPHRCSLAQGRLGPSRSGILSLNMRRLMPLQNVNRPLVSFSHSSSGVTPGLLIGNGLRRGAPISRCCRGGSILGRAARVPAARARHCASTRPIALRILRGPAPCPEGSPGRCGRVLHGHRRWPRSGQRLSPGAGGSPRPDRTPCRCGRP